MILLRYPLMSMFHAPPSHIFHAHNTNRNHGTSTEKTAQDTPVLAAFLHHHVSDGEDTPCSIDPPLCDLTGSLTLSNDVFMSNK